MRCEDPGRTPVWGRQKKEKRKNQRTTPDSVKAEPLLLSVSMSVSLKGGVGATAGQEVWGPGCTPAPVPLLPHGTSHAPQPQAEFFFFPALEGGRTQCLGDHSHTASSESVPGASSDAWCSVFPCWGGAIPVTCSSSCLSP